MARTPHRETPVSLTAAPRVPQALRVSQITHASVAERSARRLLADMMGLTPGQRLLVLVSHGDGLAEAQRLLEDAARVLNARLSVLDTRTLSLASESERRAWREALERCQACVLLGGEGRPAAARFETDVRVQTGGKPLAILRFDPDALLAHGLLTPSVLQRAYGRYLLSRLTDDALVSVRWQGGPALQLLVGGTRGAPRMPAAPADFEYPLGHVAVSLASASGHLAAPTSILAPQAVGALPASPSGFQFHAGALRAVSGDESAWLGRVARAFPGLRLGSLGFGLVSPTRSSIERAGVRLTDVGCSLTVVDTRQRGSSASVAAHRGLTFCLNGPGLDVDIDSVPIMRDGVFVEPVPHR
ncbi:MAG: hypothetical protein R3B40_03520 [Polyangiales bacterium]|nr:hypothetical protein [Myxococcales bacterium]MCB9661206.1 hypothetical protein [Sandaracinaceae bacterium]